jgi:hypothetical protein
MREQYLDCEGSNWGNQVTEGVVQSRCLRTANERSNAYVLVGDSHAEHLFIGLAASYPKTSFVYTTREGLPLLSNPGFTDLYRALAQDLNVRGVLISAHWASKLQSINLSTFRSDLEATLSYLVQHEKMVYLFDDVPIFPFNAQRCAYASRLWITHKCDAPASEVIRNPINLKTIITSSQTGNSRIHYIDPSLFLCAGDRCSMANAGSLLYRDRNHLNILGSMYIGQSIQAIHPSWFSERHK